MLKIITDSCADLEESFVQEHNIGLANLHLQVDGANYTPGEDITTAQALAKIAQAQEMPKTSHPSPHAYQQLFAQTEPVGESLCLTVSSDLSGSFN
ncbi:MAG: DegV family protein, partial [Firmicutes bacterium]|nr:DegV family protein [Bacillota bacterium]